MRSSSLNSVQLTRSYHSADCDMLTCSKVKFQLQRIHHSKREGKPCIDTSKTWHQENVDQFVRELEDVLTGATSTSATERWEHLRDTIYVLMAYSPVNRTGSPQGFH